MICQLCQSEMQPGHDCTRNVRLAFGDLDGKAAVLNAIANENKRRSTFDRRTMLAARLIVNTKIVRTKIVKKYGADAVLEAERRLKERQKA